MNAKPKDNQKIQLVSTPPPAHWGQLQHIKTFMGLSRRRPGQDEVLGLIDTRQIKWAWDIARRGARRPEVRIWRESLLACLAQESGVGAAPLPDDLTLSQVIEAILPKPASLSARAATLPGAELQRRLLCCRMHLDGLIADGELCRIGPACKGKSPVILYHSAFEFLKRRSLTR